MKKYLTVTNENKNNMTIELKQFMLDCLDVEKPHEKKLYDEVEAYNGSFYKHNDVVSLFWEIVEFLDDDYYKGAPYSLVDEQYTEWTDLDHSCEYNILVIKRKSDNQLFGVKYENPAHDSRHLFNDKDGFPTPFKPINKKEVVTYEYKF